MDRKIYIQLRKELSFKKSWPQLVAYLGLDLSLYALVGGLLFLNNAWSILSIPLVSILMFRNFALMHDASHAGLVTHKPLRYCLGLLSGMVCFLPYDLWKKSHLQHHYWAGNYEQDPVLMIVKKFPRASAFGKKVFTFFWKSGIPFAGFSQNVVFWINAYKDWRANIFSLKSWFDFCFPLAAWAVLLMSLNSWQLAMVGVGIYCYLRLVELVNFPHHVGLYLGELGDNHLQASEQHQITRTCLYSRWFEKFIILNFNYHSEHHMFPDLPWHQLAEAHLKIMQTEAKNLIHIVDHSWIQKQQKKDFSEFLFPSVGEKNLKRVS